MEFLVENKLYVVIGVVVLLVVGFLVYWFKFRTTNTHHETPSSHEKYENQSSVESMEDENSVNTEEKRDIGFTSGGDESTVSSYETSSSEGMNDQVEIVSSANTE